MGDDSLIRRHGLRDGCGRHCYSHKLLSRGLRWVGRRHKIRCGVRRNRDAQPDQSAACSRGFLNRRWHRLGRLTAVGEHLATSIAMNLSSLSYSTTPAGSEAADGRT